MSYSVDMIDATYKGDTLVELGLYQDPYKKSYYRTLVLDTSGNLGEKILVRSLRTRSAWVARSLYALLVRRYIRR